MKHGASQLSARLCRALRSRDDAVVAALLREGADPNLVLPEGMSPMHLAAGLEQENGIRGLRLLLQHGGDPDVRSGDGLTPLHVAASWGCTACLRLLLAEGGDPQLEDQEGNTALDLAVQQGNETCAGILQGEGGDGRFAQRRAESFLSTITEDAGETGPGDSLPYPPDRLPPSSLKEARQHGGPPGTFPQSGGAAPNGAPGPCTRDRSASSFLTECSWRGDTILDLSDFRARPADAPDAFLPPRNPASSYANVQTAWDGEVGRVKHPWDIQAPAEGGCSSPPGPDTALGGPPCLVGSEALSFRPDRPRATGFPRKTQPSASLRPEPEAARLLHPQDAHTGGLSQGGGCLDPGLLVGLPSLDGLDATCLDHLAESTAVSDFGKIVVEPASVLGASGTLDGCSARGRSPGSCSTASTDRYLSCMSECYTSAVEDAGHGCVHEWEDGKAASTGPAGSCNSGHGGRCPGPPAHMGTGLHGQRTLPTRGAARVFPGSHDLALPHSKTTWEVSQRRERSTKGPPESEAPWEGPAWVAEGPPETQGLPVECQGPALSGAREELAEVGTGGALPTSPWQAAEGPPSSSTQDTVPVRWTSEEGNRFRDCEGPLGTASTVGDTEVAPCPPASVGEGPPSTLDAQLRSMMLATKVAHSPSLPLPRKCCPAPPWPQSPRMGTLPQQSLQASSLFEEPLEMPRRPRRVRRAPGPASPRGATSLRCWPPPAREAKGAGEGRAVLAVPSSRELSSNPGPCSLGCPLAGSRRDVGRGEGPSGRTGKPPPGDAARDPPEVGHLESLGAQGSPGKPAEKTPSRVSFSRLSGRVPPATCPPGKLSPLCQEVPLSPGGRPAYLSTTEPVEYLYVDEDEGQTLIERHLPPTDDSGASSSEDALVHDWQACTRAAAGSGARVPLNPEHLTDQALARELRKLGADPGPVTPLTRRLYVGLLERLSRDAESPARKGSAAYSPELASALDTYRIPPSKADEMALAAEFDRPDKSRRWREGLLKSSFNYLLLDPRVTQNLPARCQLLSPAEAFRTFVRAVFYVGKGTRGRPYRHLYEALTHYREGQGMPAMQASSKVRHILEIWAGGQGVVSIHCFQNVVPVEAYTREACMVDAIGLKMLTNQKKGNCYGTVAGWPTKRRRGLGVFLLHRALRIFLAEGERQLRPTDIGTGP